MKVVVTGSNGFIGKHACTCLMTEGHTVTCMDRQDPKRPVELTGPLSQHYFEGAEVVIHCAAKADISRNWDSRRERDALLQDNVEATWNLLEACSEAKSIKSFVFCSTCAVYGDTARGVTEHHPTVATSPYVATKLAGEAAVEAYAHKAGWRWCNARLVSCVGAGYTHGHIVDFVRMGMTGLIRAKDNGYYRKHHVHVRDAAEALVRLATRQELPSGTYHVTSKEMWNWRDTVRLMGLAQGSCSWEDSTRGWIGDPLGIDVSGDKLAPWWVATRRVEDGVRDALMSLGWYTP